MEFPVDIVYPGSAPGPINNADIEMPSSLCLPSPIETNPVIESTSPSTFAHNISGDTASIVHYFHAGGETELVRLLSSLNSTTPYTVWLYADTEPENNRILGIARTIRHEFGLWRIMLAQFHPSWDVLRQQTYVWERLVPLKWVEPEILVDVQGNMHVPRIVPAPATPQMERCDNKPVEFDDTMIWRAYPPPLGPEDVEIKVSYIAVSPAFPGCSEFSGAIISVGSQVTETSFMGSRYGMINRIWRGC